jgi:hypothetical protein
MLSFEEMIREAQKAIEQVNNIIVEEMETNATQCVGEAQARTPVLTGNLRRSMTHDEVRREGDTFKVKIGSALEYAEAVEDGHRQKVGQYVPTLKKKLVKPFIQGKHMIRDSVQLQQPQMVESIKIRIEKEV